MKRFCVAFLVFGILSSVCFADDNDENSEKVKKIFEDSMKGVGDWFKNAGDEVKERAESGMATMKEFSDQAKEKSESGIEAIKGFGDGITDQFGKAKENMENGAEKFADRAKEMSESGKEAAKGFGDGLKDRFSKVKETLEESGGKMKEAVTNAAEKSKDEFESAASTVSKHAKSASEAVFGLFG